MARSESGQDPKGAGSMLRNVLSGFVLSLAICALLLLVFAVVMNVSDSESLSGARGSRAFAAVAACAGVLLGSGFSAAKIRSRGLFTGALIGVVTYVFIALLSLIVLGGINFASMYTYLLLVGLFVSGAAGGVAGVNLRRTFRKR